MEFAIFFLKKKKKNIYIYIVWFVLIIKPINSFSWKKPKQSTTRILS